MYPIHDALNAEIDILAKQGMVGGIIMGDPEYWRLLEERSERLRLRLMPGVPQAIGFRGIPIEYSDSIDGICILAQPAWMGNGRKL